jgi:hypothetical protein
MRFHRFTVTVDEVAPNVRDVYLTCGEAPHNVLTHPERPESFAGTPLHRFRRYPSRLRGSPVLDRFWCKFLT